MNWKLEIESKLNEIGWELRHCGCDHYRIVTQENKNSGLEFYHDRIEIRSNYDLSVVFYLEECKFELSNICEKNNKNPNCLSILAKDNPSIFINMHNHDK